MVGRSDYSVMILRYRANGRLDSSYGSGGAAIAQISGVDTFASGLAVRRSGSAVVAADVIAPNGSDPDADLGAVAFGPGGHIDRSFAQGGKARVDFGEDERVIGLVLQRPGRLVLVGTSWDERRLFRNSLTALAELPLRRR